MGRAKAGFPQTIESATLDRQQLTEILIPPKYKENKNMTSSNMTSSSWTVNQFNAAACITLNEINRKMRQVFEQTNRLPKSWSYQGTSTIKAELGCPQVDWETSIINGVKLKTPIVSGSYSHYTIDYNTSPPQSVPEKIKLTGMTIDIETDMSKVSISGSYMLTLDDLDELHDQGLSDEHYKILKTIVNCYYRDQTQFQQACVNAFTSYYKYEITQAAFQGRDARTNETKGYQLTESALQKLNRDGTIPNDQYKALGTLLRPQNKSSEMYTDEDSFWQACVNAFNTAGINTDEHQDRINTAADKKTVDSAFTVESLYANMESPNAMHDMGTGYMLNDVALGSPGTLPLSENILKVLRAQIRGHLYNDETSFWTACTNAMTHAGIATTEQNDAQQVIKRAARVYHIAPEDLGKKGNLVSAGVNPFVVLAFQNLQGNTYFNTESLWKAATAANEVPIEEAEKNKILPVVEKYMLSATTIGTPSRLTAHRQNTSDSYEAVSPPILDALKHLRNIAYADKSSFWQACEQAIKKYAKIDPQNIKSAWKETILADGRAIVSTIDGDQKVALSANLRAIYTDPSYKDNYVFGLARIPHNLQTTQGPFAPRNLRFSRWPLSYGEGDDLTKGSLNWNLMTSADPSTIPALPPTTGNAGVFDVYPIPDGAVGAIYISFQKIIMEVIVPYCFQQMGLDGSKWSADHGNCQAVLNQNVDLDTSGMDKVKCGKFSQNNNKIYPDVVNNRIKVDFQIDDMTFSKDAGDYLKGLASGIIGWLIDMIKEGTSEIKYRAKWSGYFSFQLNKQERLQMSYTYDTPKIEISAENKIWEIVDDIVTLGFNELRRGIKQDSIEEDVQSYVNSHLPSNFEELKQAIMLPGGAVFDFSSIDITHLGLRAHLKYQDEYDRAGSSQT